MGKNSLAILLWVSLILNHQAALYGQIIQTPDPFDFADQFDVPLNSMTISETVTITGLSQPIPVSVSKGSFSINDGAFQSHPGDIENNDQLRIMLQSASDYGHVSTTMVTLGAGSATFSVRTTDDPQQGWVQVPEILARIQTPVFPRREFMLTDFGAVGDGKTMCTQAFADAIDACHNAGGGKVHIPAGNYLTGSIHLKSNVHLYVSKNALIKFSRNYSDYLPEVYTRFQGIECYNYSPLIYAFEQENIAITGQGTIDGKGDGANWWPWASTSAYDFNQLVQQAEEGVPVENRTYGDGHYLRPSMIHPYRCKNILIDSVTVLNGPFWHIHPVLCENVTITNVSVVGHGPNNDGCNPESSRDVLIKNCYFNTGDDCIAIKAGRNADGRRINVPTTNVVIQNCIMKDGHGGVVIGSEMTGGANHVFAEDCFMDSPNLDRALRIKTNSMRGGIVEHVYLRNITVGQVSGALVQVNYLYGEGDIGDFIPIVRNVEVKNVACQRSMYALRLIGYARAPISNVRLIDCSIIQTWARETAISEAENVVLNNVTIKENNYHKIINPVQTETTEMDNHKIDYLPKTCCLRQNIPNPFNPTTRIDFEISRYGYARLIVYNTIGQEVAILVNENLDAGAHHVMFKPHPMESGLYFSKLVFEHQVQTQKMILLR